MDNQANTTNDTINTNEQPDKMYVAAEKAKEASKSALAYAKEKPDMAALFVLGVLNLFS